MNPTALLAEDEPLLMAELALQLKKAWPELEIVAQSGNGVKALESIRALSPDIAFLDIRMPGLSGLQVAEALAEDSQDGEAVPLIVFVTAYGEFALDAFERSAIDYLLKPVTPERLTKSLERLRERLRLKHLSLQEPATPGSAVAPASGAAQQLADQLAPLVRAAGAAPAQALKYVRVGRGNSVHMVPLEQIHFFQAADKYVTVATADGEGLIRESLRELQAKLDPQQFAQIHRSTLVNLDFVERADRDELGHTRLKLRGVHKTLLVSRLYAHLFKAM